MDPLPCNAGDTLLAPLASPPILPLAGFLPLDGQPSPGWPFWLLLLLLWLVSPQLLLRHIHTHLPQGLCTSCSTPENAFPLLTGLIPFCLHYSPSLMCCSLQYIMPFILWHDPWSVPFASWRWREKQPEKPRSADKKKSQQKPIVSIQRNKKRAESHSMMF